MVGTPDLAVVQNSFRHDVTSGSKKCILSMSMSEATLNQRNTDSEVEKGFFREGAQRTRRRLDKQGR
jgi:hypothetical protein